MFLKAAIFAIVSMLVSAVVLATYYGAFKTIRISESKVGPFYVAYRELAGVNAKAIQDIKADMRRDFDRLGVRPEGSFDTFYPRDSGEPNKIGFEIPPTELEKLDGESAIKCRVVESGRFITAHFPYKGPLSYLLVAMKVDPAFSAYRRKNGYNDAWAATRFNGDHILCLQPISSSGDQEQNTHVKNAALR